MKLSNNTIIDVNGEVYNFNNKGLNNFSSDVDITNFEQVKTYVDSHYIRPSFHDGNYIANNIKIHSVKLNCNKSLAYNVYEDDELVNEFYNCNFFIDELQNHFTHLTNLNLRFAGRSNGYIVLADNYKPYNVLNDNLPTSMLGATITTFFFPVGLLDSLSASVIAEFVMIDVFPAPANPLT